MRMEQDNATQEQSRIGKPCVIRDNNGNEYIMKSRRNAARWLHGRGLFVSEATIVKRLRDRKTYRIGRYTVTIHDGSSPVSD